MLAGWHLACRSGAEDRRGRQPIAQVGREVPKANADIRAPMMIQSDRSAVVPVVAVRGATLRSAEPTESLIVRRRTYRQGFPNGSAIDMEYKIYSEPLVKAMIVAFGGA